MALLSPAEISVYDVGLRGWIVTSRPDLGIFTKSNTKSKSDAFSCLDNFTRINRCPLQGGD
jgi:hypothetical protein